MNKLAGALALVLIPAATVFADQQADTGDTAWIIVATALVMMMTPAGLALFYGGMSRYKNLLNTLLDHIYSALAYSGIQPGGPLGLGRRLDACHGGSGMDVCRVDGK